MKAKYIVIEDEAGLECPIIFPNHLLHRGVAQALSPFKKPISAGFVELNDYANHGYDCYGSSISLGIESRREDDARLISKMMSTDV